MLMLLESNLIQGESITDFWMTTTKENDYKIYVSINNIYIYIYFLKLTI